MDLDLPQETLGFLRAIRGESLDSFDPLRKGMLDLENLTRSAFAD
jgi:hypothetical protein